jgi:hypothetical protein
VRVIEDILLSGGDGGGDGRGESKGNGRASHV